MRMGMDQSWIPWQRIMMFQDEMTNTVVEETSTVGVWVRNRPRCIDTDPNKLTRLERLSWWKGAAGCVVHAFIWRHFWVREKVFTLPSQSSASVFPCRTLKKAALFFLLSTGAWAEVRVSQSSFEKLNTNVTDTVGNGSFPLSIRTCTLSGSHADWFLRLKQRKLTEKWQTFISCEGKGNTEREMLYSTAYKAVWTQS